MSTSTPLVLVYQPKSVPLKIRISLITTLHEESGCSVALFLRKKKKKKKMPPARLPKASLEEPQKGPGDGKIWNLITRGSLSHALTLGK